MKALWPVNVKTMYLGIQQFGVQTTLSGHLLRPFCSNIAFSSATYETRTTKLNTTHFLKILEKA